jgi:hypothetical protein
VFCGLVRGYAPNTPKIKGHFMTQLFCIQKQGVFLHSFETQNRIGFHSKSWVNSEIGKIKTFSSRELAHKYSCEHRVMCSNSEIIEYAPEKKS